MTWKEFMADLGYEVKTTFWEDFGIAEHFGISAIRDTYRRAMTEWKGNVVFLTELTMVLNHKIGFWYEKNESVAKVYDELWREADAYAVNNLEGDDLDYFYRTTD